MKKAILAIALVATGLSSFGQGYFLFTTGTRQVWDTIAGTPVTYKPDAGLNVAFLWAPSGTTAAITGLAASSTTNGTTSVSYATAWNDILGANGGYTLAVNNGTSATVVQTTSSVGGISYNSANTFAVTGTTGGSVYSVYAIAWSNAYSTPQAAQTAGAAVGWSSVFSYSAGNGSSSTPLSFSVSGLTPFGLAGAPVPEPGTIALAGMGIASLLAFRRRNSK